MTGSTSMQVVDHEPHDWFLLRDADGYVLDVNCNISAVGFDIVTRLTAEETQRLERQGRQVADDLARSMQAVPSQYRHRRGGPELDAAALAAILHWQSSQRAGT